MAGPKPKATTTPAPSGGALSKEQLKTAGGGAQTAAPVSYEPFGISQDFGASTFLQYAPATTRPFAGGMNVADQQAGAVSAPLGAGGDVSLKVGEFLQAFAKLSPQEIATEQERLVAAGLLDRGAYTKGVADDKTIQALGTVIQESQRQESSYDDALARHQEGFTKTSAEKKGPDFQKQAEDDYHRALYNSYEKLWGVPPPPGYIEGALGRGMNIYEFEYQERQKPSFSHSMHYQQGRIASEAALADWTGSLG